MTAIQRNDMVFSSLLSSLLQNYVKIVTTIHANMDRCASTYYHINYYRVNTTNQYEYCKEDLTIVHLFNTVIIMY